MLDSLGDVLARASLRIPSGARMGFLAALALVREPSLTEPLPPPPGPLTPHTEDDDVLWTALAQGAGWLVIGNRRHFSALTPLVPFQLVSPSESRLSPLHRDSAQQVGTALAVRLVRDAGLRIVTPREFIEQEGAGEGP